MVEDDAHGARRRRRRFVRAILFPGAGLEHAAGGIEDVDDERVRDAERREREALEAAAEVDVLLREIRERAVLVLYELHED